MKLWVALVEVARRLDDGAVASEATVITSLGGIRGSVALEVPITEDGNVVKYAVDTVRGEVCPVVNVRKL